MKDLIVIAILVLILGLCIGYIVKEKKKGKKCIGCPYSSSCNTKECCNLKK